MTQDSDPTVSVVIPTLGRPALGRAVSSALTQCVPVEVIVVNDSGAPIAELQPDPRVVVVDTLGRTGASAARNLGMRQARGRYIAFLDDDDHWLEGHLESAVRLLEARPEVTIYCSRGLVIDEHGRGVLEPLESLGKMSVARYHFFGTFWLARGRRILTPTLVFRTSLADHAMDTSMPVREDTWWLLSAEAERGAVVHQSEQVGVVVHACDARGWQRDSHAEIVRWASLVDHLIPGAGAGFLTLSGRATAAWGRPDETRRLAREAVGFPGGWRFAPILIGEVALAHTMRGLRLLQRHERAPAPPS